MTNKLYRPKDAEKVNRLHPDLAAVVYKCAELGYKFIVITTDRGRKAQNQAAANGFSKAKFGQSPHNYKPCLAVDLGPHNYPGVLSDYDKIAKGMKEAAAILGVNIEWGGNWTKFKDRPHFQLANWKKLKGELAP